MKILDFWIFFVLVVGKFFVFYVVFDLYFKMGDRGGDFIRFIIIYNFYKREFYVFGVFVNIFRWIWFFLSSSLYLVFLGFVVLLGFVTDS